MHFDCESIQGKVATVQQEGKKEKFIVSKIQWVGRQGGAAKGAHRQLAQKGQRDFVASAVDLSSRLPVSQVCGGLEHRLKNSRTTVVEMCYPPLMEVR